MNERLIRKLIIKKSHTKIEINIANRRPILVVNPDPEDWKTFKHLKPSTIVLQSEKELSKKNFYLRFLWKISYRLILIWKIQKSNSFYQFFIFIFIFASISQKCLQKLVKSFSLLFSWKLPHFLILKWKMQKLKTFPPIFSPSFSFLPQLVKNVLKNGQKFFLRFSWKLLYILILIWRIQKSNSFSQTFSPLFLPWLVKNVLQNGSKIFFLDVHGNCHIT